MSASDLKALASAGTSAGASDEGCIRCGPGRSLPAFSMAFQPIVDVRAQVTVAYEALVRGPKGQPAAEVLGQVPPDDRYAIDQACRVAAIERATALGLLSTSRDLCVNFYPNAVYEAKSCLQRTLRAAKAAGLPLTRIIFEITELERLRDPQHLRSLLREYRREGLRMAIDDFGAGFAGLSLLAEFQPDILKIDLALVAKIQERRASRMIVKGIVAICLDLGIQVIAEGVEELPQQETLCDLGVHYMQGNFFAPAGFEHLPAWPAAAVGA